MMLEMEKRRPWTADTRIAFLLAMRLTGGVRTAAAEIGRDVNSCYRYRALDADFAAAWDAIVAQQRADRLEARLKPDLATARCDAAEAGVTEPEPDLDAAGQRRRRDGMTLLKQRAFLRALGESGSVERACRAARVSDTAAYNLRQRDADFAAAWDRAQGGSTPTLEQIAYDRAINGWEEPVYVGGKQVGVRRRFSEPLMRQLMIREEKAKALASDPAALRARADEAAAAANGFFATWGDRDQTNRAILAKLQKIEQGHRYAQVLAADRMRAAGICP